MFITAALAHGSTTAESVGVGGPFILLIVAAAVVSLLVAEKKWRRWKRRLQAEAEQADGNEAGQADAT